jgi:hypothetical protein
VVLEYPGGKGGGMDSNRYSEQVLEGVLLELDSIRFKMDLEMSNQLLSLLHERQRLLLSHRRAGLQRYHRVSSSSEVGLYIITRTDGYFLEEG